MVLLKFNAKIKYVKIQISQLATKSPPQSRPKALKSPFSTTPVHNTHTLAKLFCSPFSKPTLHFLHLEPLLRFLLPKMPSFLKALSCSLTYSSRTHKNPTLPPQKAPQSPWLEIISFPPSNAFPTEFESYWPIIILTKVQLILELFMSMSVKY